MIIFDLDGTLSIVGDRLKYLQGPKKDWDSFYEACGEDEVNFTIAKIFRELRYGNLVNIVTGRRESTREKTLNWLNKNGMRIPSSYLHMRKDGDYRHDTIVKPELVKDFIGEIEMVFEDRASMVNKWRELGLTVLQVAEGDF